MGRSYDDEKLGFNKVAPFYYFPAGGKAAPSCTSEINREKWNSLPKIYQSILRTAAGYANVDCQAKYDAQNPAALKKLVAAGVKLRPFPQPVMEACFKAANDTYAELTAKNAKFKKVHDSYMGFRGDQYLWWQVAEYKLRQLHDPPAFALSHQSDD